MILILNGADRAFDVPVLRALERRLPDSAILDVGAGRELDAARDSLRAMAAETVLMPARIGRATELRALRRHLAPVDSTSFAFLLPLGTEAGAEALELRRQQLQEADVGDVGYPVPDAAGHSDPADAAASFVLDLVREPVTLIDWDPAWPAAFAVERERLLTALPGVLLEVHHIGSTAVEGLPAKPILDLAATVEELEDTRAFLRPLRELGYHFMDYPTNLERCFFLRGRPRTHHLHLVGKGAPELEQQLRFRDALRRETELRERYAELKRTLASSHRGDRARYSAAKGTFVAEVLAR